MIPSIVMVLLIVLAVIVKPLFMDSQSAYLLKTDDFEEFDKSISLLETLSELDIDYKMGKLTQEDYEAMRNEYQQEYLHERQTASPKNPAT